ncbi:DNA-processing protein DprA [Rossellomorea pakistanensis]|uniref:DNA-processing protein DprA n=1 Tax=Rossellomorea pakistanensis TaxID=992288 RepID=UPI003AF1D6B6
MNQIYILNQAEIHSITGLSLQNLSAFFKDLHSIDISSLLFFYQTKEIQLLTILDNQYPPLLKQIYDPPWVLFLKGNQNLLEKENKIAIVGSRKADNYTDHALHILVPKLVQKGYVIVSGLALGADEKAHRKTIEYNGSTIGVLGGGFFHLYPERNSKLAQMMMRDQLVISEFPPDTKPQKWCFPLRNRIISGLSKGIIVTQAAERSGTLITAEYGLNEGREVFALPGSIHHPLSKGTNQLIQQGAKLITSSEDVFSELEYKFY